jgi:hypothetical protein
VLPISVTWTAPGVQSPRPVSHRSVRDEAPPSLHRVPAHGFPAFDGTMRRSDFLTPSPHASFCFAWRYRSRRRYFAPTDPARVIGRPGLGDPGPGREYAVEGAGRPTFLGNPDGPMPCSPTPARPTPPGHSGDAARPPHTSKARALAGNALGAQSHDLSPGCLRFAVALTGPRRKTGFRLPAKLCRVGLVTHRVPTDGFDGVLVTSSPPSPSFRGARTVHRGCRPVSHCGKNGPMFSSPVNINADEDSSIPLASPRSRHP